MSLLMVFVFTTRITFFPIFFFHIFQFCFIRFAFYNCVSVFNFEVNQIFNLFLELILHFLVESSLNFVLNVTLHLELIFLYLNLFVCFLNCDGIVHHFFLEIHSLFFFSSLCLDLFFFLCVGILLDWSKLVNVQEIFMFWIAHFHYF